MFFNKKIRKPNHPLQKSKESTVNLTLKNARLLWLCQCLNVAVIALELSTWMQAILALLLVWQGLLLHKKKGNAEKAIHRKKQQTHKTNNQLIKIPPLVLGVFALLGCAVIFITAKQVGLLASMVHLLCFSYVLKAFELKARRDFYQLFLLGLFVLASSLIFQQDLAFSLLTFLLLIVNLVVLLQFFTHAKSLGMNFKVITILLGQSMILAIVLFVIFPRLSPFWQVPLAKSAEIGLSDTVKPGDIADLTRSTKLAFRVDFNQLTVPDYSQLYWRTIVLENYDGKEWSRSHQSNVRASRGLPNTTENDFVDDALKTDVQPQTYQVIAEPSFQQYLFALAPAKITGQNTQDIRTLADYTFQTSTVISQAFSYQLTSSLSAPISLDISKQSKARNLRYPKNSNPRLEKLGLQLQQEYVDVEQRAKAVLSLINKQQYSYTLQPPLLINNSLDQFFFDTKAGFCAHYASAFTYLMRASGIPARMVTGYLGGEFNGDKNTKKTGKRGHLSVYQYDAHAWSEIWVTGKGWLRIDPTGAVDPERVNSGWSTQLQQQQSSLNKDLISLYQIKNSTLLNGLRLQFDALDYQWTRWVIGFTSKRQYELLKHWFGEMFPWKLALIITVALVVSMAMLLFILQFLNRIKVTTLPKTRWQLIYLKALKQLAKKGLEKPKAMTVNDFSKMVRAEYPEISLAFTRLSGSYNSLSYKELTTQAEKELTESMQQQYQQLSILIKKKP
jgi:transglutaminase-like putative cysteine protease